MIIFKERHYKLEKRFNSTRVNSHPLESFRNITSKNLGKQVLSKSARIGYVDPLSNVTTVDILGNENFDKSNDLVTTRDSIEIEPWSSKRLNILMTYTTSEKLSIISSFLINKPNEEIRILNKPTLNSIVDKVKIRLEQLDVYDEEIKEVSNLSVQQFTDKMFELQNALSMYWLDEHRVKTLQIVIQSTKLLSETSVPQFFPSKFVLVTDLVDNFGKFVFDRLKQKSGYTPRGAKVAIPLSDNFVESQVPELAKEMARNWFYKVSSIREAVARLYVEASLVPCYRFFDGALIPGVLMRLVRAARGIGDPLLATYARAYVVRVGVTINPSRKDYIECALEDTLQSLATVAKAPESHQKLFLPAVDWIMSCLCAGANEMQLDGLVAKIEATNSPLLLHAALNALSALYIGRRALHLAEVVNGLPDGAWPRHAMFRQLGGCVSLSGVVSRDQASAVMKIVWRHVSRIAEPRPFIECADAWSAFVAENFDATYVNRFIGHIAKEMARGGLYQDHFLSLQSILGKVVASHRDFQNLFSSSEFNQFLALFDKDHVLLDVRQVVLERFFSIQGDQPITDPIIIQGCMRLLKEMHDSLNSLSVNDNRRVVSKLVLSLLSRIRFEGKNVEKELSLLTQFRSMFGTMEVVIYNIVERINSLAMRVRSLRPDNEHNESSGSFVRACMAFNFITIPSIEDTVLAVRLYTTSAQVALINGCLGQAEACLEEAIQLLSKMDGENKGVDVRAVEPVLVAELAANIASTLLMCPDLNSLIVEENSDQSQQILPLLRGLINAVNLCPALKTGSVIAHKTLLKGELFIKMLLVLSALSQSDYLYHAGNTDSNDKLYGSSDQYLQVISEMFNIVLAKIQSLNCDRTNELLTQVLIAVASIDPDNEPSS